MTGERQHHGPAFLRHLHYTDAKTDDHPIVQQQTSLQKITDVTTVIPEDSVIVYTDGSLQDTGTAGCAYVAYSGMTCVAEAMHRLPDWASTTRCELQGILRATNYVLDEERSGLVISDSRSGLESITSPRPVCQDLVRQIQHCLIREKTVALLIHFIWIPSNIGLHKHDYVDNLAKSACTLPIPDDASTITTGRVKTPLKKAALQTINEERSKQRGAGVSVRHYCKHCDTKYQYSRNKCLTRLSDVQ
ncbi:putative RNase H-containing protein 2 [Homarus americanus]|uniref:Putative RNase H-containing protein 2 n=1 Tax=Homarus americanus TaxID=6706 RepID=A0A8J5K254_HOMAM|nr:putative RNase H-containing protein 2 [Homarus americanus]